MNNHFGDVTDMTGRIIQGRRRKPVLVMQMIRNRLKWWRHYLQIDTQTEFAVFLGVKRQQVNLWENHQQEPNLETVVNLWQRLRTKIPDLNLQDIIEHDMPPE